MSSIEELQSTYFRNHSVSLRELWQIVYNYGVEVRSRFPKEGQKAWELCKDKLSKLWLDIDVNDKLQDLFQDKYVVGPDTKDHTQSELVIGDKKLRNEIENHHFCVQLARVWKLEFQKFNNRKLSVLKLMQLAYNAGQLSVVMSKDTSHQIYPKEFVEFYEINKLDQIETYISLECANLIPQ